MSIVLQKSLPDAPWLHPQTWRLPGVQPFEPKDWLIVDDAFEGQMRRREALISSQFDEVHALLPEAQPAAAECLDMVLEYLPNLSGFEVGQSSVIRPDGV